MGLRGLENNKSHTADDYYVYRVLLWSVKQAPTCLSAKRFRSGSDYRGLCFWPVAFLWRSRPKRGLFGIIQRKPRKFADVRHRKVQYFYVLGNFQGVSLATTAYGVISLARPDGHSSKRLLKIKIALSLVKTKRPSYKAR